MQKRTLFRILDIWIVASLCVYSLVLILGCLQLPIRDVLVKVQIIVPLAVCAYAGYGLRKYLTRRTAGAGASDSMRFERWLDRWVELTLFLFFINSKLLYTMTEVSRSSDDAQNFIDQAKGNPFTFGFWTGYKPPLLPFLMSMILGSARIFGFRLEDDYQLILMTSRWQLWFSIFSWAFLAWQLRQSLKSSLVVRWIGEALVLFLGTSFDVSFWDFLPLSESLCISTYALWTGWVVYAVRMYALKNWTPKKAAFFAVGFAVATFLFYTARDTNGYIGLAFGACALAWLVCFGRHRTGVWLFAGLALIPLIGYGIHTLVYEQSLRWEPVMTDIIEDRIYPDEQALAFFSEHGMPNPKTVVAENHCVDFKDCIHQRRWKIIRSDVPGSFDDWIEHGSKRTYFEYLLANFSETVLTPVDHLYDMFYEINDEYRMASDVPLSYRIVAITELAYSKDRVLVRVWLGLICVGALITLLLRKRLQPQWFLVAVNVLMLYPLAMLIWHSGTMELSRHAALLSVQLRFVLVFGTAVLIDEWFPLRSTEKSPAAPEEATGKPKV